jgi:molecular chaperone DnaJ
MRLKNYYKILELSDTASPDEVKKAYRQLALKHHPDKNNGNPLSELYFKEIQEAYHILSDPHRRTAYNQKRWYSKHSIKKQAPESLTAYKLFSKSNELNVYLRALRPADINKKPLFDYIRHLLSKDALMVLKRSNDPLMNKEIIFRLLEASEPLSALEKEVIINRLKSISDQDTLPLLEKKLKQSAVARAWERYQFLFIIFITIILCWIIYQAGNL